MAVQSPPRLAGPSITRSVQRGIVAGMCLVGTIGAYAATNLIGSVIVSGGNTAHSPGGCYTLVASVGQPATGSRASGGNFALQAGFLAGRGNTESIFNQGFEVCS